MIIKCYFVVCYFLPLRNVAVDFILPVTVWHLLVSDRRCTRGHNSFHPGFGYMPTKSRPPRALLFLYPHMFLKMYIYFMITPHYKLNNSFTMFLMEILSFDAGLARLNV